MSIKKWITNNRDSAWKLGILLNGYEDLKANKIQFVSNGIYEGKKWFADPFILSYDDNSLLRPKAHKVFHGIFRYNTDN